MKIENEFLRDRLYRVLRRHSWDARKAHAALDEIIEELKKTPRGIEKTETWSELAPDDLWYNLIRDALQ